MLRGPQAGNDPFPGLRHWLVAAALLFATTFVTPVLAGLV